MEEATAIDQLKRGNLDGLETLVKLHQLKAIRTASLITGSPSLAEDIVQNAFLKVVDHIGQFREDAPFFPWFARIVINDAIKSLRRDKNDISLDRMLDDVTLDLKDPAPLPEEVLESKETRDALWQALAQLDANERATFVMRYYLQMPEREVAEVLQGPTGTIKWWAFSARRRMRQSLVTSPQGSLFEAECDTRKGAANE
jgi:RNA polymerase sigma-70 factor, ECF subfamily